MLTYVATLTLCFAIGCGDDGGSTSADGAPAGADAGTEPTVLGNRLFPVSEFQDPVDAVSERTNLNQCQVWIDRFQPRDRIASERVVLTFNDASQWVLEEIDIGNDQQADRRRSRQFNPADQLSLLETDNDGDGVPDQRVAYQWEGNQMISEDHDQNADGIFDGRRRLRYNANTWLVADEWVGLPLGDIQKRTIFQYDGQGRQVSAEHTVGIEERLAWKIISSHDEYGRLADWQEDRDGDNLFDYRILYVYDDLLRQVTERHDQGNDGSIDGITVTNFDERNRPILREVDQGGDGTTNERVRFEYLDLQLLRRSLDSNLDGREDQITTYQYDELGRVIQKSSDVVVSDDVPPESWTVSYFCP